MEANAKLTLEAGEIIHLKPGTHFKPGSKVHLKIHYDPCPGFPRPCSLQGMMPYYDNEEENKDKIPVDEFGDSEKSEKTENGIILFPNPNTGNFSVVSSSTTISSLQIYDINGLKIDEIKGINSSQYKYANNLKQGVYIVYIHTLGDKVYPKKIIVL